MNRASLVTLHVPALGEGLFEVRIVALHKKPGDFIAEDEPIYDLESDKATVSIESPHAGILQEWLVEEGSVIRIGSPVATLESTSGGGPENDPALPATKGALPDRKRPVESRAFVPPRTRAYARNLGLSDSELASIPASGSRLTPKDIDLYRAKSKTEAPKDSPDEQQKHSIEHSFSKKQRTLIYRMRRSQSVVIPCTMTARVSWDGLVDGGMALLSRQSGGDRPRFLSPFQMFAFAVSQVVKEFPVFRSQVISDESFREHPTLNLGIAVHLPAGELVTAVIEGAEQLEFIKFVDRFHERVERAMDGIDQAGDSTQFVLSYLGESVVDGGSPLLVAPAIAVLACSEERRCVEPGSSEAVKDRAKLVANISLTFDHRLIQGVTVVKFLERIAKELDQIRSLGSRACPPAASSRPGDSSAEAMEIVLEKISAVTGRPQSEIDPERSLGEQGIDSLKALALKEALERLVQSTLPATLIWRYPTARMMATFLTGEFPDHFGKRGDTAPTTEVPIIPVLPQEVSRAKRGPMAIVGLSFRFPGNLRTLDDLWAFLAAGKSAIGPVPKGRFEAKPGDVAAPWQGGFLDGVDQFDAEFFNVSPLEAQRIDPQQRVFLETVWHALEDAGVDPTRLSGSRTGVFAGLSNHDYLGLLKDHEIHDAQSAIGISPSILSSRISYLLNLRGPSQTLDTACSSSLVALHQAIQSIEAGDCDQAIVGGVNFLLSQDFFKSFQDAGMLSPSAACRTFDDGADGYVRSEGVAALLIKPLYDAQREGNLIYGIVKGSAVNHGGRAHSLTAPNPSAQADLLRTAYQSAHVPIESVGYFEAHGTGTKLGDPIEVEGLLAALESGSKSEKRGAGGADFGTALGSIKPNLGHLEAVAGLAGLIKMLACFKHGKLPGSLHLKSINRHIDLANRPLHFLTQTTEWKRFSDGSGRSVPRRAGVSSFGFGGVNAHVILEEHEAPRMFKPDSNESHLVVVSARNDEQLKQTVQQLHNFVVQRPDINLAALSFTLQVGRAQMKRRAVFVISSALDLVGQLSDFLDGKPSTSGRLAASYREIIASWLEGREMDWSAFHFGKATKLMSLPGYPFAQERHWIESVSKSEIDTEALLFKPVWKVGNPPRCVHSASGGTVLILGESIGLGSQLTDQFPNSTSLACRHDDSIDDLASKLRRAGPIDQIFWMVGARSRNGASLHEPDSEFVQCFRWIKALLSLGFGEHELLWTVITQNSDGTRQGDQNIEMDPIAAGLHGLFASMIREQSNWKLRLLDLENSDLSPEAWISIANHPAGGVWARRRGCWFHRQLLPVQGSKPKSSVYRRGGVYLVIGGAGGIGALWTHHMVTNWDARVIWIGRRSRDEALRTSNGIIPDGYFQADVASEASLADALRRIKERYSKIDGVIHSAVGSLDQSLAGMDEGHFRAGLAAKVGGMVSLMRAMKREPIDFLVCFSSIASFVFDSGKSSYATACAFQDAYAAAIQLDVSFPVRVMNWGYWGAVGIGSIIPKSVRNRLHCSGMGSIEASEGLQALEQLLSGETSQLVMVKAAKDWNAEGLVSNNEPILEKPTSHKRGSEVDEALFREKVSDYFRALIAEILRMPLHKIQAAEPLETYGIDSILVIQITARLRKIFGTVESSLLFEIRTIEALAKHFIDAERALLLKILGFEKIESEKGRPPVPASEPARAMPTSAKTSGSYARAMETDSGVEPIAIIGMSGAFPQSPDLESFWENLKLGKNCVTEIPKDRWSLDQFFEVDQKRAMREGKSYSKWGSFLETFADFDPLFFNISPREALTMDPQERLFLEHSWRAMEDAGYTREQFATRFQGRVGVFAGVTSHGFDHYAPKFWGQTEPLYAVNSFSSIANRVSYFLDLCGPSMPVDTMCSSSLTAIHQACEHLHRGDCALAITGGVHLNVHPSSYIGLCAKGMLSADGKCRSFGEGATGFVPGEGVGVLVLKRLSQAIADGDSIHALICGSQINHGGKTNGYTVPNPTAQMELVRQTLDRAGVNARDISCIEAHGTGTELGDPIEVTGLTQAFSVDTKEKQFCSLGSVKSNLGHLEAAAGIAGVMKVILQLRHGKLAPTLHAESINPEIDLTRSPFFIQRELTDWNRRIVERDGERLEIPRSAGVSSFGAGGSNAHIILQEYVGTEKPRIESHGPQIFVLSARDEACLKKLATDLLKFASRQTADELPALADIAHTLQIGREAMDHRLGFAASSMLELREKLAQIISTSEATEGLFRGNVRSGSELKTLFGDDGDLQQVVESLIKRGRHSKLISLWVQGVDLDWSKVSPHSTGRRIHLPTYPFSRRRFWLDELGATMAEPASVEKLAPTSAPDLAYLPVWEKRSWAPEAPEDRPAQTILILSTKPMTAWLSTVEQHHKQQGGRVVHATLGSDPSAFQAVLRDIPCVDRFYFVSPGACDQESAGLLEMTLFRLVKFLQSTGKIGKSIDAFVITNDCLGMERGDAQNSIGGGLAGLACSMAQGDRRFRVRSINLSQDDFLDPHWADQMPKWILSENPSDRGTLVKWREGQSYQRRFIPVEGGLRKFSGDESIRTGGVYIIAGGSGIVGRIITRRLIEKYRATIIWVGRSPAGSPEIQSRILAGGFKGAVPIYLEGDVTNLESLKRVVRDVRNQFPVIHGAIFSAVSHNENNSIEVSSEEDFRQIFQIKSQGSRNFFETLNEEVSDFLCYFSSIQAFSFTSAAASSGYAAGITSADAFVRSVRSKSKVPLGVIHWGYWRAFVEGSAMESALKDRFGLIDDDEGFRFFEQFVGGLRSGGIDEIICARVSESLQPLMNPERISLTQAPLRNSISNRLAVNPRALEVASTLIRNRTDIDLDVWLLRLMRAEVQSLSHSRNKPANVIAKYAQWWDECQNWMDAARADASAASAESEWMAWNAKRKDFLDDPAQRARVVLSEECLKNLHGILLGRIEAPDIIFPQASMERVEGVYKQNPVADFFNETVADLAFAFVEEHLRGKTHGMLRIIEIGAGTGGTSAVVLERLRPFGERIEYHYTDISKAFLLFATDRYGADYSFLRYKLWNIEKEFEGQGIEAGGFDVVIATNVLHATHDIGRALRHASKALAPNGILLLNEVTSKTLFPFVTFGLLDGWWLFEDKSRRIPGSPVLTVDSWKAVLIEEGFRGIQLPVAFADPLGQQVIMAENGTVVQGAIQAARSEIVALPGEASMARVKAEEPTAKTGSFDAEQMVMAALAETLRLSMSEIKRDLPFSDFGIDSILTVAFVDALNRRVGIQLNATVIYDHPTVTQLSRHLENLRPSRVERREKVSEEKGALMPKSRSLDIAIIGMSGQFPGANNVETFWQNLIDGRDGTRELPPRYLDPESHFAPGKIGGKSYCKRGGILEERDCFDPLFFNISPKEAESMNPHQRLVLQEGWKAFEDAGCNPRDLAGTAVGIFVGAEPAGYFHESLSGYSDAIVASRLSYYLNLRGPALTVNTGCSSSALAIHLACKSLRDGESAVVLAGGVFAVMDDQILIRMSQVEMLSLSGQCSTFDAAADGTVLSEGIGMVVLKRLEDAVAANDPIYGVIAASGTNQDGASHGITAPNGDAQERLIVETYRRHDIHPEAISYVEAHGTGTRLGDPVEGNALVRSFRTFTQKRGFCAVGSAKAHIGHAAAGAGAISLIKILLSMKHRRLPGLLNFRELNPLIDFSESPFHIQRTTADWIPGDGMPRMAALNSFGHSGTNVHLVVAEPPAHPAPRRTVQWNGALVSSANPILIPLSARTDAALMESVGRLLRAVKPGLGAIEEIAFTLQAGREAMEQRALFVAGDLESLRDQLRAYLAGRKNDWKSKLNDPAMRASADNWLSGGKLEWRQLYGDSVPNRIHLPGYPFARERYWKSEEALLERPKSNRISFQFNGSESFLADHRVNGKSIVPAVLFLELVRSAIARTMPEAVRLENIVWIKPLMVEGPFQIDIDLIPMGSGRLRFEVRSTILHGELHSQGDASIVQNSAEIVRLDIRGLQAECHSSKLTSAECYAMFERSGVQYGPAFQVVEEVHAGADSILVKLHPPAGVSDPNHSFVLPPDLLDGGLQGTIAIPAASLAGAIPYALESLDIYGNANGIRWAFIRPRKMTEESHLASKVDVDWCDADGTVRIRMKGFSTRVTTDPSFGPLQLERFWKESLAEKDHATSSPLASRIVVLIEMSHATSSEVESRLPGARCFAMKSEGGRIDVRFEKHALRLLEIVREALVGKSIENILIQVIVPLEDERNLFSAMSAMLKSAAMENPRLIGQMIEMKDDCHVDLLTQRLLEEGHQPHVPSIRYSEGSRWVQSWRETAGQPSRPLAWKRKGIYLITGGAGGLGLIMARYVGRMAPESTIVLVGRSKLDDSQLNEITETWKSSARWIYRQTDISDATSTGELILRIQEEFGGLDGIIHAAGTLHDRFILQKNDDAFRRVLAPKVAGLVNLDLATRSIPLDFFILFSSISGFLGNSGQADYACANAFMDSYAEARADATQGAARMISIDWPLWSDGKMRPNETAQKYFLESFGLTPMDAATGLKMLEAAVGSGRSNLIVIHGHLQRLRSLVAAETAVAPKKDATPSNSTAVDSSDVELHQKTADHLKKILAAVLKLSPGRMEIDASWERYGIDSVLSMELTLELEKVFGSLPKTLFFEYQNLRSLAAYFLKAHQDILYSLIGPPSKSTMERPAVVSAPRAVKSLEIPTARPVSDIAIIGVAGRYPKARNISEFWENLKAGSDCVTTIPMDRWDHTPFFDTDPDKPGKTYSQWGGFLDGVAEFDPLFFNISPREAAMLDPQERLFLQCAYEVIEDAGYTRESLGSVHGGGSARKISVHVGVMYEEYQLYGAQETLMGRPTVLTGSPSSIANRVSYFFDLHGPSMAVDTMCSSSLTALHLACEGLRRGEVMMAIAGGVNISIHPNKYLMLAQGKFVSSKGRCESFGEGAEGYVPGEGVGAVLLKPLARAVADGDRIYGVIKGTSINHGGRTHGYTVPNPNAQAEVVERALHEAGIPARSISYLEAHGTGTVLGDPIEIAGLVQAFEKQTPEKQFCAIGSVKSNIGHGESSAGIGALTKVLLQMQHQQLVPSLHASVLNPNIDFAKTPFRVQQSLTPWQRPEGFLRRAGISSFGAGGANAHVVLEEWTGTEPLEAPMVPEGVAWIVLSARNEERLRILAQEMLDWLKTTSPRLKDLAFTLQIGREAMDERLAFAASSLEQVSDKLTRFIARDFESHQIYHDNIKKHRESIGALIADNEMRTTVVAWLRKGRHEKVLDLWSKGLDVDWRAGRQEKNARRISLPHYPFERERYWFSKVSKEMVSKSASLPKADSIEKSLAIEPPRRAVFLKKKWRVDEASEITPPSEIEKIILIFSTPETDPLAKILAKLFSKAEVIDPEKTEKDAGCFLDCGGCIDLIGCGLERSASSKWMTWVQRLVAGAREQTIRMLCVTIGLEAWQNSNVNLTGASRVGLYRMLQSEYGRVRSCHLDLERSVNDENNAHHMADEFRCMGAPMEICRRDGKRYRAVLEEISLPPAEPQTVRIASTDLDGPQVRPYSGFEFPKDKVLWITGGTRGLGSLCARHFAEKHGVRKMVLTGVEPLPARFLWPSLRGKEDAVARRIATVESLEVLGVQVAVLSLPLSDVTAVRAAIAEMEKVMGPAGGVIHCAGGSDLKNPAWIRKSQEGIARVLEPKIAGLDVLLESFRTGTLDFFLLFSSVAGTIPSLGVGLGDYAMANAYMDYVADVALESFPVASLQWPSWKESGAGEASGSAYQESGFLSHTDVEGLELMDRVLAAQIRGAVLPAIIRPSLWHPDRLTMRKSPVHKAATQSNATPAEARSTNAERLPAQGNFLDLSNSESRNPSSLRETRDWLRGLFAKELQLDLAKLENDTTFQDYGLDSVLLAQVLRSVNQRLKIELDPSILFEYSTIDAFTHWMMKQHGGSLESDERPSPPTLPPSVQTTEKLETKVAVIGMSCRFAGAPTLDGSWTLLLEGRSAISTVPQDRWSHSGNDHGGMLDDVSRFDANYFLISPEDAAAMDPQAFLLLEETSKAWCHAGYSLKEIKRMRAGVYIGARSQRAPDELALSRSKNPIRAAGPNYLAAGVSQFFDLRGPSVVLDSACSSALVGMSLAVQALQSGDISAAVVGGVSVLENDQAHRLFEQRGILASKSDFHIFDKRARGVVLGEGAGVVILKRLDQAVADGDTIYSVISGIAINNDGRTAGPASPNLEAQKEVMSRALAKSGRNAAEIEYIEANGSGSEVTDLLELKAIQSVYRSGSMAPCLLGSMKPNIGHPLCAEGIASFIKTSLSLFHGKHVPFLSAAMPMTHFDFQASPFQFTREAAVWNGMVRLAAINCFADGGTNAHLILESSQEKSRIAKRRPIPVPNFTRTKFSRDVLPNRWRAPISQGGRNDLLTVELGDSDLLSENAAEALAANRWRERR